MILTDPEIRNQAEAYLNQAVEAQYVSDWFEVFAIDSQTLRRVWLSLQGPFLLALTVELATESRPAPGRQLAGLYIKNLITATVSLFFISD